jgi:hypothetical protein
MKKYLTFFLLIVSTLLFGQKNEIDKKLSESFDFVKSSKSNIDYYDSFIMKGVGKTIEDTKPYIKKARNSVDDAINDVKSAKSKAYEAKNIANDIGCSDTKNECAYAEIEFNNAIDNLDYTYLYLKKAEKTDDSNDFVANIKKSRNAMSNAMQNLSNGLKKLNEASRKLSDCN